MGKSPGKWIKTVLFGKKSSKSSYPKGKEKAANEREVVVAARASEVDIAVGSPPFTSQLNPYNAERDERKPELESGEAANISNNEGILLPMSHSLDSPKPALQDSPYGTKEQEQAATIVQATFRGYLARRAFRALKGIIRLQALIRGHLVRRQAIATLCCTMRIVKLQAHARGVIVRHSDSGLEVQKKCKNKNPLGSKIVVSLGTNVPASIGKLSANAFVCKLVAPSLSIMPLHLQYDYGEPNSAWSWLERWSASCFWKPIPQPKKSSDSKLQRKQVNGQAVEMETGRPKRSVRRIPPANLDGASVQTTYEVDKPKRNVRKFSSHPAEPVQENPQNELEKVKRSLRKVHNPVVESSLHSEFEFEKPKQSLERVSNTVNLETMEQSLNNSADKTDKESVLTINSSAEKMKKETLITVNTSAEKMKKETLITVNTSGEKMRRETGNVNSLTEKIKKDTALTVNSSAEKIKKETTLTVNNLAEKIKKETTLTVNMSTEKSKKETTINNSTEKMKKESSLTANGSGEKMKKDMVVTINGSAEKMKKEMAVATNGSAEKAKKEEAVTFSKSPYHDLTTVPFEKNETSHLLHADPLEIDSKPLVNSTVKDENTPLTNEELNRKDDSANNESQKSGKKSSTHAKQDRSEIGPQSSPTLPSYMAATESAKAKLKLQGSIRSSQDGSEKTNLTRRQSLPSAANNKISSQSPRTQRLVQSGGKAAHKSDRSALSSRDGNGKIAQVEWRR